MASRPLELDDGSELDAVVRSVLGTDDAVTEMGQMIRALSWAP